MTDPELNGISAPYRLYEAAGGWVFLAASRQHEWEALVSVLGRPGTGHRRAVRERAGPGCQ